MTDRSVLVRLIADNGSFDAAMSSSGRKVEEIGTKASGAAKVAQDAFARIRTAALGIVGVAALKSGQDLINLQQSAQVAFTSITGDAKSASDQIQKIYQWDQSNPIPFQNALAAGQKLAAFGVDMQQVVPTLQAIADATGAVGGSADVFDRIALALGQIQTKGKLSAEEMLQLAEAGLPAWDILANAIGVTVPEAMKLAQSGAIDADTALEALRQGIETRFPGAAQNLKNTTLGAWQTLKAGIRDGAKAILEPLQGIEQQAMRTGGAFARDFGAGVANTIHLITAALSPATSLVSGFVNLFGGVSSPMIAATASLVGVSRASDGLNKAWGSMRSTGAGLVGDARALGQVWTLAGAETETFRQRMALTWQTANVGRESLTSLRAAGSNLLGFFGGPLGLAIMGATTLMSAWGEQQNRAKQQEAEHQAQLSALKDTLDKVSGAITAATTAKIGQDWVDHGTVKAMEQLGINTDLALQAATKGGPAAAALKEMFVAAGVEAIKTSDAFAGFRDKAAASGESIDAFARDYILAQMNFAEGGHVVDTRLKELMGTYTEVAGVQANVTTGAKQQRDAFELIAGQVALTANVSKDKLIPALDAAKASGGSVEDALTAAGFSAEQTGKIVAGLGDYVLQGAGNFHVMAGAADTAGGAMLKFGDNATDVVAIIEDARKQTAAFWQESNQAFSAIIQKSLELRQSIASSAAGFIDPVGAWSSASDAVNRRVSVSSNPAVKAADAAVKAGRKRADATKKSAADEKTAAVKAAQAIRDAITAQNKASEKATKDAQTNAQKRVDAAKKEAADLKTLADQQRKDEQDAATRLEQAKFDLAAATLNRQRAAAGLAAAETPIERANWQNAYNNAVRDEAAAKQTAASAQSTYDTTTQKATASQQGLSRATKEQQSAEQQLAQAKSDAAAAAEVATQRQQAADAALAAAKEKADARYQKAVDASQAMLQALIDKQDAAKESAQNMASGSADAVTGMVEKIKPSFADWMKQLQDQKTAQENWAKNLRNLAQKLPPDVTEYLAGLGPGAAGMIAQMNQQSTAELGKAVPLLRAAMPEWQTAITDGILGAIPDSKAATALLGTDAMNALMKALQAGQRPTRDILADFGLHMVSDALGHPVIFPVGVDTQQAMNDLIRWRNWLGTQGLTETTMLQLDSWGRKIPGHAGGGMVGDGWFWTGEQGPELGYKAGSDVRIFPAGQSAQMSIPQPAPAASGPTIIINDNSTTYYPQGVPDVVARNRRAANFAAQVTSG